MTTEATGHSIARHNAAAARPSAPPPRKQLRWNTPGQGRSAPEMNHIMWDQPYQEVSETKINSPNGADQKLEGSDDAITHHRRII